jgi:hypothetical protein
VSQFKFWTSEWWKLSRLNFIMMSLITLTIIQSNYSKYTGCFRRDIPHFGRKFFRLIYIDITKHTISRSWKVTEAMTREKRDLFAAPLTVPLLNYVARTLRRSFFDLTTKPSHTEATVLRIALGKLRRIFIKVALIFPVQSVSLCHSRYSSDVKWRC